MTTIRKYSARLMALVAAVTVHSTLIAQPVSPSDAASRAREFLTTASRTGRKFAPKPLELAYTASRVGETHFYVFNREGGGWVMIGGDEVAHEVLAYSDEGTFDYQSLPESARAWLSMYEDQIAAGIALTTTATGRRQAADRKFAGTDTRYGNEIGPLIDLHLTQGSPLNNQCPVFNNQRAVVGCVALAMAQVMWYHRWPASGVGSHEYVFRNDDTGYNYRHSADFASAEYDWSVFDGKLEMSYFKTPSDINKAALILSHIGVSVDMAYGLGGSGAANNAPVTALPTYFQYDPSTIKQVSRSNVNGDWDYYLYTQLAAYGPILYSGQDDSTGGHSFVCDGYKYFANEGLNYFSFKWGWGLGADGMFTTDALRIGNLLDGSGNEIVIFYPPTTQSIITGIRPLKPDHLLTVTLDDTKTELETTALGGHVSIPGHADAGSPFLGWTRAALTEPATSAPAFQPTGWFTPTGSDITLYPTFSYATHNKDIKRTIFTEDFESLDVVYGQVPPPTNNSPIAQLSVSGFTYTRGIAILGFSSATTMTTKALDARQGDKIVVSFDVHGNRRNSPYPLNVSISGGGSESVTYSAAFGSSPLDHRSVEFVSPVDNPTITFSTPELYTSHNEFIGVDNITITSESNTTYYATSATQFTAPLTITDAKWGTFFAPFDVKLEDGVYAYAVTLDGTGLQCVPVAKGNDPENDIIPAHTPVLVYKDVTSTYTKSYTGTYDASKQPAVEGNLLKGTLCRSTRLSPDDDGVKNYVLQKAGGRADWYGVVYDTDDGQYNGLGAFRAYLSTDVTSSAVKSIMDIDPATGISEVTDERHTRNEGSFSLSGQKVGASYRGIVIRNGKKHLVR